MLSKLMDLVSIQPSLSLDVREYNIKIEAFSGEKEPIDTIGYKGDAFGVFVGEEFYPIDNLYFSEEMALYKALC